MLTSYGGSSWNDESAGKPISFAFRFSCSFFLFFLVGPHGGTCVSPFSTEFIKYLMLMTREKRKRTREERREKMDENSFSDATFIAQHLRSKYEKLEQQWFQLLYIWNPTKGHKLEWQTFQILHETPMNGIKIHSSRVRIDNVFWHSKHWYLNVVKLKWE